MKRLIKIEKKQDWERWFLVVGLRFIVYGLSQLKTKNPFRNFGTKNLKLVNELILIGLLRKKNNE